MTAEKQVTSRGGPRLTTQVSQEIKDYVKDQATGSGITVDQWVREAIKMRIERDKENSQ